MWRLSTDGSTITLEFFEVDNACQGTGCLTGLSVISATASVYGGLFSSAATCIKGAVATSDGCTPADPGYYSTAGTTELPCNVGERAGGGSALHVWLV